MAYVQAIVHGCILLHLNKKIGGKIHARGNYVEREQRTPDLTTALSFGI